MRFSRLAAASAALTLAMGGLGVATAAPPDERGNPHFQHKPEISVVDDADGFDSYVTASGSIVGLGKGQLVTIQLVADAVVDCFNPKSNKTVPGLHREVSSPATPFMADNSGKIDFDLETDQVNAKCPGKWKVKQVDFTRATITADVGTPPLSHTEENL